MFVFWFKYWEFEYTTISEYEQINILDLLVLESDFRLGWTHHNKCHFIKPMTGNQLTTPQDIWINKQSSQI